MDFTKNLETAMQHFSTTGGFLSVQSDEGVNTMTISWGFIGFLWGKPMFITTIRPQRHTMKILAKANSFTVSIPFGTMQRALGVCGTKSGADFDKTSVIKFIPAQTVDSPVVHGCNMYYECAIRYVDAFKEANLSEAIKSEFYNEDYHNVFLGEIVDCYEK